MKQLYSFSIHIFAFCVFLASFFNNKARDWYRGRKSVFSDLKKKLSPFSKIIWFHAASVGEFEQAKPLIDRIKKQYPAYHILVTFFSPSGYNHCKNYHHADYVCYLPLDTKRKMSAFLDLVRPEIAVFIKYEFWFNLIDKLASRDIPFISVSSVFNKNQFYFQWYASFYRNGLKKFSHHYLQDQDSANLLGRFGFDNYSVAGDTRFDRVVAISGSEKRFGVIEQFSANHDILIAGSVWKEDMDVIYPFILSGIGRFRTIIAPHEIHPWNISKIISQCPGKAARYSKVNPANASQYEIIVIDNIGMLSNLYRYARIAYVGGGFGKGIHNVLEPAVYGVPVIFGPEYSCFREAAELITCEGAFAIKNSEAFNQLAMKLLEDKPAYSNSSDAARNYVMKNTGATEKIITGMDILLRAKAEKEQSLKVEKTRILS